MCEVSRGLMFEGDPQPHLYKWVQYRVFLFLSCLPYSGERAQSTQLFIHSWGENSWIHTFRKFIRAMWNANSLVQNLNSDRYIYFLWWWPWHHECIQLLLLIVNHQIFLKYYIILNHLIILFFLFSFVINTLFHKFYYYLAFFKHLHVYWPKIINADIDFNEIFNKKPIMKRCQ